MSIQLATEQVFNTNPDSERPQDAWMFLPGTPMEVISFIGTPNPSIETIATHIQNYHLTYPGTYIDIHVRVLEEHPLINGVATPMFTVSGAIADAPGWGYVIGSNNLDVDTFLDFNLTNITQGTHRGALLFEVWGRQANNNMRRLDEIRYEINVVRLSEHEIYVTPLGFVEMSYQLGGALPTKNKKIHVMGAFSVAAGKHISLSGGNLVFNYENEGIRHYTGSNTQSVFFHLENTLDAEEDLGSFYTTDVLFTIPGFTQSVGVKVLLYGNEEIIVSPSSLQFTAVKGVREAIYQAIQIAGVGSFNLSMPSWMEVWGSANGVAPDTRQVRPVHSDNLTVGTYTGKIKITSGITEHFVNVVHTVVSNLATGFDPKGINFTRDRDGISTIYGQDTHRVAFEMAITTFAVGTLEQSIFPAHFSKGIFGHQTDFWLGNVVRKVMPELTKLSQIGLAWLSPQSGASIVGFRVWKYFNPSETLLYIDFFNRETGVQDETSVTLSELRFLQGRRPSRFGAKAGILDCLTSPVRVTRTSFALLSIFRNEGNARINLYRNGMLAGVIMPDRGAHQVLGLQLCFQNFSPGDVIDVEIPSFNQKSEPLRQSYIMFPDGKQSYHIAWVNEHGTLSLLEFTGDYQFLSEHKGVTNLTFDRYLESLQKMGSERIAKFSANTGWILKANQERIDSLVDADRAWIVFSEDRPPIELVPKDAKLTNIDSSAETYQYTVEFTINPSHELDNYSF